MDYREMFDLKATRASMNELHSKTKELKAGRRHALAEARKGGLEAAQFYEDFRALHTKAVTRGQCARLWGLLYAFLRGMPYRRVEAKTHRGNEPSAWVLSRLLLEVVQDPQLRVERDGYGSKPEQHAFADRVLDDVRKWLTTPMELRAAA